MNVSAFTPGASVTIAAGAASTAVPLIGNSAAIEVQNSGTAPMFIKLGGANVAAAITDYPVLAGQSKLVGRDPNTQTYLAAITAGTPVTGYVTTGEGM